MQNNDKPAVGKRVLISKAQQWTMLEVLIASLVLGTCIVFAIFLIKYIKFNTKVISEKNEAIAEYDETIRNVGVCADKDKNGRLSDKELQDCNPNSVSLNDVPNSLRYNVFQAMAQNHYLESVARQRNENCYSENGERIDFNKLYEATDDESLRQQYLQAAKICSALRVIPDALPAQKNTEALMSSLNQVFIVTGIEPERLAPRDDVFVSEIPGIGAIPVTMRLEGWDASVMLALNNIERSIREFDITEATIEWMNAGLSLNISANAYYLSEDLEIEQVKTVDAKKKTRSARTEDKK